MSDLEFALDALAAETAFSGVVRVDLPDHVVVEKAYGLAQRAYGIPNTAATRFAIASGTKGLTALTVVSLIEEGRLDLAIPARAVLGDDLPLIPDDVTVEHLLSHRSGIGDYLDEEGELDFQDYLMPVPVQELATTEQYLAALDGHEPKFRAGERFAYCNSGYVVLALIAERVARVLFDELVRERVCGPAEMADTEFLRSDELPDRTALGYLDAEESRTNVLHLPVRGSGDGGIYTTVEDVARLWRAFLAGRIVSVEWVAEMVRPRSPVAKDTRGYGLGFWLGAAADSVILTGSDAGVSFRTEYRPREDSIVTVISNITHGASAMAHHLADWNRSQAP